MATRAPWASRTGTETDARPGSDSPSISAQPRSRTRATSASSAPGAVSVDGGQPSRPDAADPRRQRPVVQFGEQQLAGRRGVEVVDRAAHPVGDAEQARAVGLGHDDEARPAARHGEHRGFLRRGGERREPRLRPAGQRALRLGALRDAHELAADAPALVVALGEPGVLERRQQAAGGGRRQVGGAGELGGRHTAREALDRAEQREGPGQRLGARNAHIVSDANRSVSACSSIATSTSATTRCATCCPTSTAPRPSRSSSRAPTGWACRPTPGTTPPAGCGRTPTTARRRPRAPSSSARPSSGSATASSTRST